MNPQLAGQRALVTGAFSGIGLGIARALASEGVDLALASRHPEPQVVAELTSMGVRVVPIAADVSREADVVRMTTEAIAALGAVDLYVNNAAQARHQPISQIDTPTYRAVLDANLSACLWACREISRHWIERRSRGAILVVGSTCMMTPGPTEAVYRMTKFGLRSLVQSLAVELAPHGIRANLLVPGHYRTRLTDGIPPDVEHRILQEIPLRRFGETAECGSAAVFLLSSALAGYITGAELVVDGGLALRSMYFGTDEELKALNES